MDQVGSKGKVCQGRPETPAQEVPDDLRQRHPTVLVLLIFVAVPTDTFTVAFFFAEEAQVQEERYTHRPDRPAKGGVQKIRRGAPQRPAVIAGEGGLLEGTRPSCVGPRYRHKRKRCEAGHNQDHRPIVGNAKSKAGGCQPALTPKRGIFFASAAKRLQKFPLSSSARERAAWRNLLHRRATPIFRQRN